MANEEKVEPKRPMVRRPLMSLKQLDEMFRATYKLLTEQGLYTEEVSLVGKMLSQTADLETYNNVQSTQMAQYQMMLSQTEEGREELKQLRQDWAKTQVPGVKPMSQQQLDEVKRERMNKLRAEEEELMKKRIEEKSEAGP